MSAVTVRRASSAKFAINVIWNGLGVTAGLISGLLLSPYMIRRLGPDGYGVWALTFALIEYYWLLDLGFRSATVKYVAHHAALGEHEKIREVVSTALVYSTAAAALIVMAVAAAAPFLQKIFQIAPAYRSTFTTLVLVATLSWCLSIIFGVFGAALEAAQRFDMASRANIAGTVVRTVGAFILLSRGHGLIALGLLSGCSQLVTFSIQYFNFRQTFPQARLAPRYASQAMFRRMGGFGIHTFVGNVSQQFLNQSAPVLIGHFLPTVFVGFYSLPVRLLQYTVELVCRIGLVTNSSAAALSARNDRSSLEALGIYSNRYCLTLFMPLCLTLIFYGNALFLKWVGPDFASHSAPVLPVLLLGSTLAIVGQFSSTMLLQGLALHQNYSRSLLVEAALGVATMWFVIPRYGIVGAACVSSSYMIANRTFFTAWLTSGVLHMRTAAFLHAVYTRPLMNGIPAAAFAWWARSSVLPGATWLQLGIAGAAIGAIYYSCAFLTLPPMHRATLIGWFRRAAELAVSRMKPGIA